jgi:hypothetical protein
MGPLNEPRATGEMSQGTGPGLAEMAQIVGIVFDPPTLDNYGRIAVRQVTRTVLAGVRPYFQPLYGTDQMAYVERTNLYPAAGEGGGWLEHGKDSAAENLATQLGFAPVLSSNGWHDQEPFPWRARGFDDDVFRRWLDLVKESRHRLGQGFAVAKWKPVAYPLDGDWRPYEFGNMPRLIEDLTWYDPATWAASIGLIRDPFDDLAVWHGVITELAYFNRIAGSYRYSSEARGLAQERMQERRDKHADGKPLWTVNLLPEKLRDREWSMFACRLLDTHLIHPDTVNYVRHRLARI